MFGCRLKGKRVDDAGLAYLNLVPHTVPLVVPLAVAIAWKKCRRRRHRGGRVQFEGGGLQAPRSPSKYADSGGGMARTIGSAVVLNHNVQA